MTELTHGLILRIIELSQKAKKVRSRQHGQLTRRCSKSHWNVNFPCSYIVPVGECYGRWKFDNETYLLLRLLSDLGYLDEVFGSGSENLASQTKEQYVSFFISEHKIHKLRLTIKRKK